jgi:two-component system, OmpR family, alkaline phosphatase synthesis response regulator PhoP
MAVRILVADDEVHITQVVTLKLRNAGFEIITAADGEEAFEVACQDLPALIITDLQMPYLSGLELCERLRQNAPTSAIPAIMLTARGYALSQADLAKTNIKHVMSKPFSPRELLEMVTTVLGESAAGRADDAGEPRAHAA